MVLSFQFLILGSWFLVLFPLDIITCPGAGIPAGIIEISVNNRFFSGQPGSVIDS